MKSQNSTKILIVTISVLIILILGWLIYYYLKNQSSAVPLSTSSPSPKVKSSPTFSLSPTPTPSATPSAGISPAISPEENLEIYKIPSGETYEISSKADTNGDGKDEILVVTKTNDDKHHAYILSSDGKVIYDNKNLGQKPLRITTQIYGAREQYPSWMLIFTEESGNLAFIHWNGAVYEIPQDNLGI